jgi:HEAT repeat protein
VRAIAATALTYLGDLEAADVAVTVLGGRHDVPDLLASSLRLIAKLGRPEHAAAVRPLIDSGHFAVRAAAISALGAIGGPDDLAAIREGYDDASPWVAMHAARALVDAGDVRSLEEIVARRHSRASLAIQVLSELEEE